MTDVEIALQDDGEMRQMTERPIDASAIDEIIQRRFADIAVEKSSIARWYEPHCSEPNVNYLLQEIIRPGDVCFDVGAFVGGLSVIMSRLAGPKGSVISFEANNEVTLGKWSV